MSCGASGVDQGVGLLIPGFMHCVRLVRLMFCLDLSSVALSGDFNGGLSFVLPVRGGAGWVGG